MKLSETKIIEELDKITDNLWDFLFISATEPNTFAETYGDKFILFDRDFFNEIEVYSSNQKLNDHIMSKLLLNLIHELENFLIRHLCSTINMFNKSPKSTEKNDAGVKLEKQLFGKKVEHLGFYDTAFLNDKTNWENSLTTFKKKFKEAVIQNKKVSKSERKSNKFQTYTVGRKNSIKNRCGTNLTANSYLERMKKYGQEKLESKEEKTELEENPEIEEQKPEIEEEKSEIEEQINDLQEPVQVKQTMPMCLKKRKFKKTGFLNQEKIKKKV